MIVSLIAAVSKNMVIGKDNDLIWKLPDDMKYFKEKTLGHHVLTGRKNYESIPLKYRPLSQRTNLVVSRQKDYSAPGARVFHSIEAAIEFAKSNAESELFVIGGAEIYARTIDLADKLYITWVNEEFEGDACFPKLDSEKWKLESESVQQADHRHAYSMRFCVYMNRKKQELKN